LPTRDSHRRRNRTRSAYTGATGVDEHLVADPPQVHPRRTARPKRGDRVSHRFEADLQREVVERAGRHDQQRNAPVSGVPRGQIDSAVTTSDTQHRGPIGSGPDHFGQVLARLDRHDLGVGQLGGKNVDDLVRRAPGTHVDHHDGTATPRRCHRPLAQLVGDRPPAWDARPPPQRQRPGTRPQRHPGQHVGRVVRPGDHPRRGHAGRDDRDRHREQRKLDRHTGRERGSRRGVPGREGRRHRAAQQPPNHRNTVRGRPGPPGEPLGDQIRHGTRGRQGDEPTQPRPPSTAVPARGQPGGDHRPEPTVVRRPAQHRQNPVQHDGLSVRDPFDQPEVGGPDQLAHVARHAR